MSADLNIDKELAICEAATQWGVLRMHTYEDGTSSNRIFEHLTGRLIADNVDGPDATFIAHARTGYPLALRKLARLRELLAGVYRIDCVGTLGSIQGDVTLTDDDLAEVKEILGDSTTTETERDE